VLQARRHHAEQAVHEGEPEGGIALALGEEGRPVEGQRLHAIEGARLEVLAARRQQRRPAELVARRERLHAQRRPRLLDLERDQPRGDEVEVVALVALVEEHVVALEAHRGGQCDQLLDVLRLERLDEMVAAKRRLQCLVDHGMRSSP
jgi:hypothetical protein